MAEESAFSTQIRGTTVWAAEARQAGSLAESSLATQDGPRSVQASDTLLKKMSSDLQGHRSSETNQVDYTAIYAEVFLIRDEVHESVIKFHQKLKLPFTDTTQKPDWNEVDTSVKDACDAIQRLACESETTTGAAGSLRRAFRSLCKHAGAGETFVSIIPTDQFGFASVLCGGLKAVFSALKHTHEYREKVYQALEDLPYIICDHSVPLNGHTDDEELHRRAAGLHVAVFKVVKRILRWWLAGFFVLALKSIANPSRLLSDLNEDLAEVKVKASRFQMRALNITQSLQRQSFHLQYLSALNSEREALEMKDLRREVKSLREIICRATRFDDLASATNRISNGPANDLSQLLTKSQKLRLELSGPSVDTLLAKFFYERSLVIDDCQDLMKFMSPQRSLVADHDRILAIEGTFRIQAWLVIDEPSLLLIDGRAESRRDTEVSVFVARIVHQLHSWQAEVVEIDEDAPIIVPVAFFCCQHRERQDEHSNPTELAMSLLLQLIDRHRVGFGLSLLEKIGQDLDPGNMSSVCSILEELIITLRRNVVLILLVEGLIHFTQDDAQSSQTRELISCLVGIYRRRPAATLKLLFSSPTRPDFVEDLFRERELLRLPRSVASVHSPNNMHWKKPVEFRSRTVRDDRHR